MALDLNVNGATHSVDVDPQTPLLWVIRDSLGLTGTKFSCGIAQCGACTLHVDGQPVRSCSFPVSLAVGKAIKTIEGVSPDGNHPIQRAWKELDAPQCGYCQSGMIMSALALLERNPASDRRRHRRGRDECLPLLELSPRAQSDPLGRRSHEGVSSMKAPTANRREVLAGAGAFVLGFWLPPRAAQASNGAGARCRLVHGARGARDQRVDRRRARRHRRRFASRRPSSAKASGPRTR